MMNISPSLENPQHCAEAIVALLDAARAQWSPKMLDDLMHCALHMRAHIEKEMHVHTPVQDETNTSLGPASDIFAHLQDVPTPWTDVWYALLDAVHNMTALHTNSTAALLGGWADLLHDARLLNAPQNQATAQSAWNTFCVAWGGVLKKTDLPQITLHYNAKAWALVLAHTLESHCQSNAKVWACVPQQHHPEIAQDDALLLSVAIACERSGDCLVAIHKHCPELIQNRIVCSLHGSKETQAEHESVLNHLNHPHHEQNLSTPKSEDITKILNKAHQYIVNAQYGSLCSLQPYMSVAQCMELIDLCEKWQRPIDPHWQKKILHHHVSAPANQPHSTKPKKI